MDSTVSKLERLERMVGPRSAELLVELERKTRATIYVEAQDDNLRIEIFGVVAGGRTKLGYFRASVVTLGAVMLNKDFGRFPPDCREAWERAGKRPLWNVRASEWYDPQLRGHGFGVLAYRALVEYALDQGGVIGPDRCGAGSTSSDAELVWASLCRRYRCLGPLVVDRR